MESFFEFLSSIGGAVASFFLPITTAAMSLLLMWPMISGILSTYQDAGNLQQECGVKDTPHEMSQCFKQRLQHMQDRLEFTNEYGKKVVLPYHGIKL